MRVHIQKKDSESYERAINKLEKQVKLIAEDNDYLHDCIEDLNSDLDRESHLRNSHCIRLIDIAQDALNLCRGTSHGGTIYVGADRNFARESLQKSLDEFKKIYRDE